MHTDRSTRCVASIFVVAIFANLALTGPFLPDTLLPDDVLSLDDLSRVHVKVDYVPPQLVRLGLTHEAVQSQLRKRLRRARIEVIDGEDDENVLKVKVCLEEAQDVSAPGVSVEKVIIDCDTLVEWCLEQGRPVDGEA